MRNAIAISDTRLRFVDRTEHAVATCHRLQGETLREYNGADHVMGADTRTKILKRKLPVGKQLSK